MEVLWSLKQIRIKLNNIDTTIKVVNLLNGVETIGAACFQQATRLNSVILSDTLKAVGDYAFYGDYYIGYEGGTNNLVFPSTLLSIGTSSFQNCTHIQSVIIKSLNPTIKSNSFAGCTELTNIYVAWSEGEVAGAPWGAVNATITYNYTGD